MRNRRDVSAGVIVFHRSAAGCRFLLLRSKLTRRPLWEFPKGGVLEGETLVQAALRELHEETGLSPEDVRLIEAFERNEDYRFMAGSGGGRTHIRKRVTYYLAEALRTDITISTDEATRFAWLSADEAKRKLRYKARREMLASAQAAALCDDDQPESSSRSRDSSAPLDRRRA
jgi:8-oxo-dGTP pyrophosphatase MutT (NUDIX family)